MRKIHTTALQPKLKERQISRNITCLWKLLYIYLEIFLYVLFAPAHTEPAQFEHLQSLLYKTRLKKCTTLFEYRKFSDPQISAPVRNESYFLKAAFNLHRTFRRRPSRTANHLPPRDFCRFNLRNNPSAIR